MNSRSTEEQHHAHDLPAGSPQNLGQLFLLLLRGLGKGFLKKLALTVVTFLAVWVLHTYLLVGPNNGFWKVTNRFLAMILALKGGMLAGTMFWALLFGIVTSLAVRARQGGLAKLKQELSATPGALSAAYRNLGGPAVPALLGGIAAGVFLGLLMAFRSGWGVYLANRLVNLLLVLALFLSLSRGLNSFLLLVARLTWNDCQKLFNVNPPKSFNPAAAFVCLGGVALGVGAVVILPFLPYTGYLVFLLFAVLTVVQMLNRSGKGDVAATALALLAGGAVLVIARTVLAHDGGWSEYGGTFFGWATGGGAFRSILHGILPAGGAATGAILPGVIPDLALTGTDQTDVVTRTAEDIYKDPRLHDQFTDAAGKEWVYFLPPGDQAPQPFWVPKGDYDEVQGHLGKGHVFHDGGWWENKDDLAEHQRLKQKWREDRDRENAESARRGAEERRLAAEKRAEEQRLREEREAREWQERHADALRKRDQGIAEAEKWDSRARKYDIAYYGTKFVGKACDVTIDALAKAANLGQPVGVGTYIQAPYKILRDIGSEVSQVYHSGSGGSYTDAAVKGAGTGAYDSVTTIVGDKFKISDRTRKMQLLYNTSKSAGKEFLFGKGDYEVAITEGVLDTFVDPGDESVTRGIAKTFYEFGKDVVGEEYKEWKGK